MKVIFRTDASRIIATGHVMRCLTLASALRERDALVSFVCREHIGNLCDLIEERGFSVNRLPAPRIGIQTKLGSGYAAWLGADWREDAEQTRAAMAASGNKPDWLVVDHYAIDKQWEGSLRPDVGRILAIDDLADRTHDCDLLLDQNLVARMHARYDGKVPEACALMLGPEYALLQPIYRELRERTAPREGPIRRLFIFFGGSDEDNLTGRSLSAFLKLNRPDIKVDAVISGGCAHEGALRRQIAGHSNISLHGALPTLAPLMAQADLAIGAGGATSWERLCLGLPSLVLTMSENQRPIAEELNRRGMIRWLGHKDDVQEDVIAEELDRMIQGAPRRWIAIVDGKGVDRVSAALTVTAETPLRVRRASADDEGRLLDWANDPATRRDSLSSAPISADNHHVWFAGRLRDSAGCRMNIVETVDGVSLGQVRFERHDRAWEVHYAVAPPFRGCGLGRPLLDHALRSHLDENPDATFIGIVKDGNIPSCRIFESLGFHVRPGGREGGVVYQRAC